MFIRLKIQSRKKLWETVWGNWLHWRVKGNRVISLPSVAFRLPGGTATLLAAHPQKSDIRSIFLKIAVLFKNSKGCVESAISES